MYIDTLECIDEYTICLYRSIGILELYLSMYNTKISKVYSIVIWGVHFFECTSL